MPTIRQVTVYKFEELSAKAKKKAIEDAQTHLNETLDSDYITEDFKEHLKGLGLPHKNVRWSLSSSQGDGVAFYGKVDLEDYIVKNKLKQKYKGLFSLIDDGGVKVEILKHRELHMYDHYNTMTVDMEVRTSEPLTKVQEKLLEELEEEIKKQIVDVSRDLEKSGYSMIESETSEAAAKDLIEANEYDYNEHGKIV